MKIEQIPFEIPVRYPTYRKKEVAGEENMIEIVDIVPEKPVSDIPVFFAPGMAAGWEDIERHLKILGQERRVLSLKHPKKELIHDPKENNPSIEIQKALSILSTLEQRKIQETYLVATSGGGPSAVLAAYMNQYRGWKGIILIESAGLSGKQTTLGLGLRYFLESRNIQKRFEEEPQILEKFRKFQEKSALARKKHEEITKKEIEAIKNTDVLQMLEFLKSNHIPIVVIHGADEKLFPMKRLQERVAKYHADGVISISAGHYDFLMKPEKIMPIVNEVLSVLEKRKLKNDE